MLYWGLRKELEDSFKDFKRLLNNLKEIIKNLFNDTKNLSNEIFTLRVWYYVAILTIVLFLITNPKSRLIIFLIIGVCIVYYKRYKEGIYTQYMRMNKGY